MCAKSLSEDEKIYNLDPELYRGAEISRNRYKNKKWQGRKKTETLLKLPADIAVLAIKYIEKGDGRLEQILTERLKAAAKTPIYEKYCGQSENVQKQELERYVSKEVAKMLNTLSSYTPVQIMEMSCKSDAYSVAAEALAQRLSDLESMERQTYAACLPSLQTALVANAIQPGLFKGSIEAEKEYIEKSEAEAVRILIKLGIDADTAAKSMPAINTLESNGMASIELEGDAPLFER